MPHRPLPAARPTDEPAFAPPSTVWTRQPPAWRAGLAAAGRTLGAGVAALYFGGIRLGLLSWGTAILVDLALAVSAGVLATWWTWARRARIATMLDSAALLPWFVSTGTVFVIGMQLGARLMPRFYGVGVPLGVLAAAAWTSWYLVRWGRRHPATPALGGGLT